MALTKADIIEAVQKQIGLSKKECADLVEHLLESMKKALENDSDILISGFGKFCVNQKKARRGRNPASGEDMILEERRVVTFKCSGKLRERMNNHG
ncbi:MAG: integration host factor subunit alpha [Desulfobacterales bacterium]